MILANKKAGNNDVFLLFDQPMRGFNGQFCKLLGNHFLSDTHSAYKQANGTRKSCKHSGNGQNA